MGIRFWKRIRLGKGITLNLSKSGPSISAGPRGAKVTLGRRGLRTTAGLPGTGISYSQQHSSSDGTLTVVLGVLIVLAVIAWFLFFRG